MPTAPVIDVLVVGAGLTGCTAAARLAEAGRQVLVMEARSHLGGHCHDHVDAHGVLVQRYGPHIFHTNSDEVLSYLSRFTAWRPYQHRVLACIGEALLPFPINRTTINRLYGLTLDSAGVRAFLDQVREPRPQPRTSEDLLLAAVGRDLYERFFRHYTRKQWGLDPSELEPEVAARIPVRTDDDDRYFIDRHQCMPADGFTALVQALLDHPRIHVETSTHFVPARDRSRARQVVYTGPLDAWFGRNLGQLPYRSLRFEHWHEAHRDLAQPVAVVNHPSPDVPWTRITEFKHLTGQRCPGTSLVRELPQAEGEPYYPIPTAANRDLASRYRALVEGEKDVVFAGRLAQYRYYNMDQAVAAGLLAARKLTGST
jgi:UDP-galactopyranose mutase